ncbi:methyl-accepting chemotaxis protein [Azospirillum agricola]|uniref:methyl-accepting chemotaxis protein n=1 Tax=Azospirillum agricola TaxID=1720247 RepID=UPI001AE14097|nr:methyl-accepting chemotaxis protein [Azospirillum agricola]MBP2227868.1 methyl-accepting chemotaxis protein [Azospirillum agricola]
MTTFVRNLKIGPRLWIGYAAVIAVLILVSVLSITSARSVEGVFAAYRDRAGLNATIARVEAEVITTRNFVKDYLRKSGANFVKEADASTARAVAMVDEAARGADSDEMRGKLATLRDRVALYGAEFDRSVTFQDAGNAAYAETKTLADRLTREARAAAAKAEAEGNHARVLDAARLATEVERLRGVAALFLVELEKKPHGAPAQEFAGLPALADAAAGAAPALAADAKALLAAVTALDKAVADRNRIVVDVLGAIGPEIAAIVGDLARTTKAQQDALAPLAAEIVLQALIWLAVTVVGAVLVSAVVAVLVGRSITSPLQAITTAMRGLADGHLQTAIPGLDRRDEIGAMAGAVGVFKEHALERQKLEAQQQAETAAKERRQTAMDQLTQDFNRSVSGMLRSLATASTELHATAQSMSGAAAETSERSTAVASAAEQAAANVQTVAAAAEELAATGAEISRHIDLSSTTARQAVEEANRASAIVGSLSEAGERIGAVVSLINDIASQTNLLALNATIEAARAGEAGKGFAVVASEVKNLASQTAKATEQVSTQVASVQEASREAAAIVTGIARIISEVNTAAGAMADAVGQQGAATQDIAVNVTQAFTGTREVSSNIGNVSETATVTGAAAEQVLAAASDLSRQAETLRGEVENFLSAVSHAGERRAFIRYVVELPIRISVAGQEIRCRTHDLSLGGAAIEQVLAIPDGTAVELSIDGGATVNARIAGAVDGRTRFQFRLDAATRARITALLDRLPQGSVAA